MQAEQRTRLAATALAGFFDLCESLNLDSDKILAGCEINRESVNDINASISYHSYADILTRAAIESNRPHFGLLLAEYNRLVSINFMGMVGLCAKYYPTVGEAISAISSFHGAGSQGSTYTLEVEDGIAFYQRVSLVPEFIHNVQLQNVSLAEIYLALTQVCGKDWHPFATVYFSHEAPADIAPYKEYFSCRVVFGESMQGLCFPGRLLDIPIESSNANLAQYFQGELKRKADSVDSRWVTKVEEIVGASLPLGKCSVESVADGLHIHPRTLRRRLRAEGTTFSALVETRRKAMARSYLLDTHMSLQQVSMVLGYKDPNVFTRAFRRWYGSVPSQWRKIQRGSDPLS